MLSHRCAFCGNQTHFTARFGRTWDLDTEIFDGRTYQVGKISVAATCDACQEFNVATGDLLPMYRSTNVTEYLSGDKLREEAESMTNASWSPPSMVQADTEYIPQEIAGFFQEAHDAFSVGAFRGVLLLCRSVIEATAKINGINGANLLQKIDNMEEQKVVRPGTKDIAHAIRVLGNDMAHGDLDDPPSKEDAEDVLKLVRLVLDDVYVADAMRRDILTRRGKPIE